MLKISDLFYTLLCISAVIYLFIIKEFFLGIVFILLTILSIMKIIKLLNQEEELEETKENKKKNGIVKTMINDIKNLF